MSEQRITAVILAAGKGTRLKTAWPKVLHEALGRPLLAHVLDACRSAGVRDCIVVVGHEKQQVIDTFADDPNITWVEQTEQRGTGHAVMMCREALAGRSEHVLVLCGDAPLIRAETIRELIRVHRERDAAATLATAELDDPTGYGRIVRDAEGRLLGIVEQNDCTEAQARIREINPSYYCIRTSDLLESLTKLAPNNAKGEYYLTDCFGVLVGEGKRVEAVTAVPPEDVFGINSRHDLALVNGVMRERINRRHMDAGVTLIDPATTWIDERAAIGQDTILYPFVTISGAARIGSNCRIGPLVNVPDGATIADGQTVGPGGAR